MDPQLRDTILTPELYFLIVKFLSRSPFKETSDALVRQLENLNVLPKRLDWTGQQHNQGFRELERLYPHIGPEHLLEICLRLGPLLHQEIPPTIPGGLGSFLGAGRQSLLRSKENTRRPKALIDYCTRKHQAPLADVISRNNTHNIVNVLYGRESAGPIVRKQAIPTSFYGNQNLLRRTLGHLSAVYCVLFDRSGKYIITGADDLLVKLWSAIDGRLLITFRGASAEITDIAINLENTMLAAGSLDRMLRVWDLQTASPIAVLGGHNGMITSVNFCPSPRSEYKYLVTTSTDGSVAFWQYTTPRNCKPIFHPKPTQYHEKLRPGQAQMICASFSPGGTFLAAGSADHHVRVYLMPEDGPKRILEVESHTDTVDSIQWAHSGLRFVSGSKDGTALLWNFDSQQWKSQKLSMSERLPSCPVPDEENKLKLKVTMVSWDQSDSWIVTAVNDHTIKVWNAKTAKLHKVLRGHTDELYVLESHPKDIHVLLSAGHDGQLFIWDIYHGIVIKNVANHIDGQGHGGIFDAKWSPDGNMIAATDSHGHILMFGFGMGHPRLSMMPKELFFHTDYRPLIRDVNYYVLDEQTQLVPHLMPPPFLVDIDGNPYPPAMQRLVPGREDCSNEQLVPNIALGVDGYEVDQARSDIDRLIEALANRQIGPEQPPPDPRDRSPRRNSTSNRNAPRRNGDVEGVRQSVGNWQREEGYKPSKRNIVRPISYSHLQTLKHTVHIIGLQELEIYKREMRRRPLMINTGNPCSSTNIGPPKTKGRGGRKRHQTVAGPSVNNEASGSTSRPSTSRAPAPSALRHQIDEDDVETSTSESSDDSTAIEDYRDLDNSGSSSSDTESSEYSDWIAVEDQHTLQPPKRSKRRPVERRAYSPDSDENAANKKKGLKTKKVVLLANGEIPEEYKPPEWLSEVIPKKAPYYPQMGDEVAYLRQGHARYLEYVKDKNIYEIGEKEPWRQLELRAHEFCKVIGIKYEIRPPRLCCLKLALMTDEGNLTDKTFTIKYHDIPDVLDFLVLKQTFDTAIGRNWGPGDRFRCMIDDKWWIGEIESHCALNDTLPDSLFMCFKVRWDNAEYEFMSPWDLEPVDPERLPPAIGGGVLVLPEEIQATLYRPKSEEWPRGDRDGSCRRIVAGMEEVMGLAIADPFLTPVDLNSYPTYAFLVEYPIDLQTIKARFENHFYRRITSAQFDVRYLATNAEKFNKPHSIIVKHARIITDLCLRILRDFNPVDVSSVYHQLLDTYVSSESEDENQPGPSTSAARPSTSRANGSRRSKRLIPEGGDWRIHCRELLQMIIECNDSTPFRQPVDTIDHPDYLQIVQNPMDLQTVKEELLGGNYESPNEFAKDVRLIFTNSRNYNTNKRSRIYTMTLRLSTLFEDNMKPLVSGYKSAKRRGDNDCTPRKRGPPRRPTRAVNGTGYHQSGEEDDENDDDYTESTSRQRAQRSRRQNTNGVSSSNIEDQPGPSRRSRRTSQQHSSSDSSASSSSDSETSGGIPLAELENRVVNFSKRSKRRSATVSSSTVKAPRRSERSRRSGGRSNRPRRSSRQNPIDEEKENEDESDSSKCDNASGNSSGTEQRPSRRQQRDKKPPKRLLSSSDGNGSSDEPKRSSRRNRYESDQSFRVDKSKKNQLASESEDEPVRPTRESARKALLEWSKADSSVDDEEDQRPQTSTQRASRNLTRNKKQETSTSTMSSQDQPGTSARFLRVTRNQTSQSQESESEVNLPSTSSSSFRNGLTNGLASTSQRSTRSSSYQIPQAVAEDVRPHEVDHNYGEPGLSSSSTSHANAPHRMTRRTIISRHQRNADELDMLGPAEDPLNIPTTSSSRSTVSRLRSSTLPGPSNNSSIVNGASSIVRRTTRNRRADYFEDDSENNEPPARPTPKAKIQVKTEDSDSYSEEDNTPLKQMTSPSRAHQHNTRNSNGVQKVKRVLYSDEDQPGPSGSSGPRTTRNMKRPHYNEDTDEDKQAAGSQQRRSKRRIVSMSPTLQSDQHQESSNSDNEENGVSVSSRGRIRKITAKARGLFKE